MVIVGMAYTFMHYMWLSLIWNIVFIYFLLHHTAYRILVL